MYVDDDETLAYVISRMLMRLGYRCTSFTEPQAALQEFRTAPLSYDAVMTDLQMPGMSGLELVQALRRVRPDIPAAVTSGVAVAFPDDAMLAGVSVWVAKPCTLAELSCEVHAMLRK